MKSPLVAVVAVCAVLPLVVAEVWTGFRVGLTDPVLSVIAPSEQPLSVRSFVGLWAMLVAVGWFAGAYWRRQVRWWEVVLVVCGGALALARVGNAWVFALAMVMPLARQLALLHVRGMLLAAIGSACVLVSAYAAVSSRPRELPPEAQRAAVSQLPPLTVFADWRWAGELQRRMSLTGSQVVSAGSIEAKSTDFWMDYVRVADGHERWSEILQTQHVNMVVLDSTQEGAAADLVRASSDWRVTYDADGALVAVRTTQ